MLCHPYTSYMRIYICATYTANKSLSIWASDDHRKLSCRRTMLSHIPNNVDTGPTFTITMYGRAKSSPNKTWRKKKHQKSRAYFQSSDSQRINKLLHAIWYYPALTGLGGIAYFASTVFVCHLLGALFFLFWLSSCTIRPRSIPRPLRSVFIIPLDLPIVCQYIVYPPLRFNGVVWRE